MKMFVHNDITSDVNYDVKNGDLEKLKISAEAQILYYELIKAMEEEEMVRTDILSLSFIRSPFVIGIIDTFVKLLDAAYGFTCIFL